MTINYVTETSPGSAPSYSAPGAYTSKYQTQLDEGLDKVTNFTYDPLKDASYKALAKVYNSQGEKAAKNTMGDAAALNGGYGTSYATSAAQQARNDYNSQLASHIPDLEQNAYNRNVQSLSAIRDADNTSYNQYRDTVSDKQWQHSQDYQKWSDQNSNYWNQKNYNLDVYQAKKAEASGYGSSSGGSGYGASGSYYGGYGSANTGYGDASVKAATQTAQSVVNNAVSKSSSALSSKKYSSSKKSTLSHLQKKYGG